jgi:uncharacterized protein (TIGR03067 family)
MMRLPAAVLLLIAGAVVADDAAAKKMLKDLEGSYIATSMIQSGVAAPDESLKTISVNLKGDKFTIRFKKGDGGEEKTATIVVDPVQKPITIDLTPKDGPKANIPVLGIVKVEKDAVTLCWNDRGDKAERPKVFASTNDNKNLLLVLKKAK